ncbi:hypothetical protein Q1695_004006 [Nippostrongylus brasiliensis]|nr:hypothetical protein Q1695_004006 [Nippostrongylus brasiliensis]
MRLVVTVIALSVAHQSRAVVDYPDEKVFYAGVAIHKLATFMGRQQPECANYKVLCNEFMKCLGNCDEKLIPVSQLNNVSLLTDEQRESSKHLWTNPCVGMFAFCLSVDYFQLAKILDLHSPDIF